MSATGNGSLAERSRRDTTPTWEATSVEDNYLRHLIHEAVKRHMRPALWLALTILAAVVAFGVALLATQ